MISFRTVIALMLLAIAGWMALNYVIELYLFFTDKRAFLRRRKKLKITAGEDGPEMGPRTRLVFGYPFLIIGCGGFGYLALTQPQNG